MKRFEAATALLLVAAAFGGCRKPAPAAQAPEGWSVTAWGQKYEIFAEVAPLIAGEPAMSGTHVTVLSDFSPLRQGSVSAVLRGGGGADEAFKQDTKKRDGIYPIEIKPRREGEFDLFFVVEGPAGREEIAAGHVRVGGKSTPGGRVKTATTGTAEEGVSFLKEQQWRTPFSTDWVRETPVPTTLRGPAHVRPAGGGETVLTASLDAVVSPRPWPFRGQALGAGATVFQLTPQVSGTRSEAELDAEVRALATEVETARSRSERLRKLVELDAVSKAELERAESTLKSGEARLSAARRDLATARAARSGGSGGASFSVRAPWAAQVADVTVSPGQAVSAGTALARLVKPSPVWIEVALQPSDAALLRAGTPVQGLFLRRAGESSPISVPGGSVRLVSRAPEVDPRTATVTAIFEVRNSAAEFPFGTAAEADVTLPGQQTGVAVPTTALVDDGGVTVAYVQLEGESFARREVRVRSRQGDTIAIEGVRTGERVVTQGGQAIRRASLLSTGAPEGHVH
jgi:membrane fusion protein, heavy metal efflux system